MSLCLHLHNRSSKEHVLFIVTHLHSQGWQEGPRIPAVPDSDLESLLRAKAACSSLYLLDAGDRSPSSGGVMGTAGCRRVLCVTFLSTENGGGETFKHGFLSPALTYYTTACLLARGTFCP